MGVREFRRDEQSKFVVVSDHFVIELDRQQISWSIE